MSKRGKHRHVQSTNTAPTKIRFMRWVDISSKDMASEMLGVLDEKIEKQPNLITGPSSFADECAKILNNYYGEIRDHMLKQIDAYVDVDKKKPEVTVDKTISL